MPIYDILLHRCVLHSRRRHPLPPARQSLHASDTLIRLRVPFSNQLCVVPLDFVLNPFDRLEVFDSLDVEFGGRVFVHYDQRTRMQLQRG